MVASIIPGSPAVQGGFRAGDIIAEINGVKVENFQAVANLIQSRSPGKTVKLKVQRGDSQQILEVTLGARTTTN